GRPQVATRGPGGGHAGKQAGRGTQKQAHNKCKKEVHLVHWGPRRPYSTARGTSVKTGIRLWGYAGISGTIASSAWLYSVSGTGTPVYPDLRRARASFMEAPPKLLGQPPS